MKAGQGPPDEDDLADRLSLPSRFQSIFQDPHPNVQAYARGLMRSREIAKNNIRFLNEWIRRQHETLGDQQRPGYSAVATRDP